jgi:hypothetical protein
MTETKIGSPLADGKGTPLTPAEVDAIPDTIDRQPVEDTGTSWTYLDPHGRRRHVSRDYALPRLHGEHRSNHLAPGERDRSRGLVVLLPPEPS